VKNHYQTTGFQNVDTTYFTVGKQSFQYDGHGQLIQTTDALNSSSISQYDSIGRVTKAIGALHDTTINTYDGLFLTQIRDAKHQTYTFSPNALGWVDSTGDPAGAKNRYQYDANGNRTSWTNRRGQQIQFSYDSLNQPRSTTALGKTTNFFSDPRGRYQSVSDSESTDTLWFDAADRPSVAVTCRRLISGNPLTCIRDSSSYELRDLRNQLTISSGALWGSSQYTVGLHFDAFMRLDTLTNFADDKERFTYTSEGLVNTSVFMGLNNLTITMDYVWAHRSYQAQLSDSSLNAAIGWGYAYDDDGRINRAKHGQWSMPDSIRSFAYDSAGQLSAYGDTSYAYQTQQSNCTRSLAGDPCPSSDMVYTKSWVRSATYAYDSVLNRKDPAAPGGGLDPANRLRRYGLFRMDYDADGNLIVKRLLSGADTTHVLRCDSLFWNAMSMLDSLRTRDSLGTLTRVSFGYDGFGRRVRKSTVTGTARYLWDGNAMMMILDTLGNRVADYSYYPGTDKLQSVRRHDRGDTTFYYLRDNSGNVVALVERNSAGLALAKRYGYDPLGNSLGGYGVVADALQYAGRELDSETNLYYFRARYYDPSVGRFISEDPLGLSGGMNAYAYARNDPINHNDPTGLCSGGGRRKPIPKSAGLSASSGSCDFEDVVDAVDQWFMQNYGFGLADALAGTNGDCLFSGGGGWSCMAGGSFTSQVGTVYIYRRNSLSHFSRCRALTANFRTSGLMNGWQDAVTEAWKLTRDGIPTPQPQEDGGSLLVARYEGTVVISSLTQFEIRKYSTHGDVECTTNSPVMMTLDEELP